MRHSIRKNRYIFELILILLMAAFLIFVNAGSRIRMTEELDRIEAEAEKQGPYKDAYMQK